MGNPQRGVQAHVYGRVQGVGYRVWARREAMELGLAGWVRNETDGSVATLIAGSDEAVSAMIERLWKGPSGASVTNVEVEGISIGDAPADFRIVT